MIKNKITLLIILILIVSVFITGCIDKGDGKQEVSTEENIVDKDIDKDEPADVGAEKENEEVDEDHTVIIGGEEWPTEAMDDIPQIAGNITSASVVTDLRHIKLENVKKKDAESYVKELKSLGFTVDPGESISDRMVVYNAKHEDKRSITFGWKKDKGKVDLIYSLPFKPN